MKSTETKSAETTSSPQEPVLHCKLTTPGLLARKQTVIASLHRQVVEKTEMSNGYAYRFADTETLLDELTEFIKTERMCCDFFDFTFLVLSAQGKATGGVWLQITGPQGAKAFIDHEIEL